MPAATGFDGALVLPLLLSGTASSLLAKILYQLQARMAHILLGRV